MNFTKMGIAELRTELDRFVEQLARQQEQGHRITDNQKKRFYTLQKEYRHKQDIEYN